MATPRAMEGPLTAARVRELLHYDPETGVFTRRISTCNRVKVGDVCGSPNSSGYLQISLDNRLYLANRLAVVYMTGAWPVAVVDHRNTVRDDNRWLNLRDVPAAHNAQNVRKPLVTSTTGLLGAYRKKNGRFSSSIGVARKKRHLGCFDTAEQAHAAYIAAKRLLHPGNTL